MLCCTSWTMLCCLLWTSLCCTLWTVLCCQLWTRLCCTCNEQCCQQSCSAMITKLFSHDNNVVTALFNHQYCYNLLTRLSNDDNNNDQVSSINMVFSCFNNIEGEGVNLDRCLVPCHGKCKQIQSRIEFIPSPGAKRRPMAWGRGC